MPADLIDFLRDAVARGASDLHVVADTPPVIRVDGSLGALNDQVLDADTTRSIILGILTETQRTRLEDEWELDFALAIDGIGRFRGNAHYNRGALEAAFRHIPQAIPTLQELGHRPNVQRATEVDSGLILVTGITGSGKSTTQAAILKQISESRSAMIITVEDPIEFIFSNSSSVIKQREVGHDTKSFADALKHVLRQDPDVILVGEMRDLETIRAAITAAETGHLVLATLHTIDAPKAIDRIVDAFPAAQQPQIISQLAGCLKMVISQRLLPHENGSGRALATEVLVTNNAVRACIRDGRYEQLVGLIEIGTKEGMHTIDESLIELYRDRQISKEQAVALARDRERVESISREPARTTKRGLFG